MRLFDPPAVEGWTVVILVGGALAVELVIVLLALAMPGHSMNIRAAFLHNLADALGSVAVIVAGTLRAQAGDPPADARHPRRPGVQGREPGDGRSRVVGVAEVSCVHSL